MFMPLLGIIFPIVIVLIIEKEIPVFSQNNEDYPLVCNGNDLQHTRKNTSEGIPHFKLKYFMIYFTITLLSAVVIVGMEWSLFHLIPEDNFVLTYRYIYKIEYLAFIGLLIGVILGRHFSNRTVNNIWGNHIEIIKNKTGIKIPLKLRLRILTFIEIFVAIFCVYINWKAYNNYFILDIQQIHYCNNLTAQEKTYSVYEIKKIEYFERGLALNGKYYRNSFVNIIFNDESNFSSSQLIRQKEVLPFLEAIKMASKNRNIPVESHFKF